MRWITPRLGLFAARVRRRLSRKIRPSGQRRSNRRRAARLQRGSYLVNTSCSAAPATPSREHGNTLTEPERTDAYLAGGNVYNDKGIGVVSVPNITPDVETGIGGWKDDRSCACCATASPGTATSWCR